MLDGIKHDADEVLTGTNPDGDARLLAAINGAFEDAFDGGCRADVPDPLGEVADEQERRASWTLRDRVTAQARTNGRVQGIVDVCDWLRANHYPAAAQAVALNGTDIGKFIEDRAARGD